MVTIGFVSLGCAKNLVDSEVMLGILSREGYEIVSRPEDADVIVVNTCGFIDSAKQESIDTILEMASYKQGRCRLLIMAGCLAERYHDEVFSELPEVDAVVGTGDYPKIAEVIARCLAGEKVALYGHMDQAVEDGPRLRATAPHTAYLKIADGCDNRCTYCVIPSLRGRYRSRPMADVLAEAEGLAAEGVKELLVIAQDTSRYGTDLDGTCQLPALLRALCAIPGIRWVRVHYLYPEMIGEELIRAFQEEEKLVNYMDIPIQHCNDRVLRRMGRHTSHAELVALIARLRREIPGIVLRTSLIAGFPGETEEEAEELLAFVRKMRFDRLGAFAYSQEEGTPAARLDGQLPDAVKQARADRILEAQAEISLALQREKLGKVLEVLVEGYDADNLMYYGRTYADSPDVDGLTYFAASDEVAIGSFVHVKILDCDQYDLTGEMTD